MWWTDDQDLIAALGSALRTRSTDVDRVVQAGEAVFAMRSVDVELAELLDAAASVPTRAERTDQAEIRELVFSARSATVHVEIDAVALRGQVVPPQPGIIEVHRKGHPQLREEIDEHGWFRISPVPSSPFRLLWRTADGRTTVSHWLSL